MANILDFPEEVKLLARKRLPPNRFKQVENALKKFQTPPLLPALRFRIFEGIPGAFIINANEGDRILLIEFDKDMYEVFDIDTHDALYRRTNRNRDTIIAYIEGNKEQDNL